MKPISYFERLSELSLERHGVRSLHGLTSEQRSNIIGDVFEEIREYNKWKYGE